MPFFDNFASRRWSPLCMHTQKWCHFAFVFKSFQTKKIKALRPKMTKIASRGSCLKKKTREKKANSWKPGKPKERVDFLPGKRWVYLFVWLVSCLFYNRLRNRNFQFDSKNTFFGQGECGEALSSYLFFASATGAPIRQTYMRPCHSGILCENCPTIFKGKVGQICYRSCSLEYSKIGCRRT